MLWIHRKHDVLFNNYIHSHITISFFLFMLVSWSKGSKEKEKKPNIKSRKRRKKIQPATDKRSRWTKSKLLSKVNAIFVCVMWNLSNWMDLNMMVLWFRRSSRPVCACLCVRAFFYCLWGQPSITVWNFRFQLNLFGTKSNSFVQMILLFQLNVCVGMKCRPAHCNNSSQQCIETFSTEHICLDTNGKQQMANGNICNNNNDIICICHSNLNQSLKYNFHLNMLNMNIWISVRRTEGEAKSEMTTKMGERQICFENWTGN